MSRRPLIALTANLSGTGPLDGAVLCARAYTEAIAAAGGMPLVLPPQAAGLGAVALLSRVDGIVFTGGRDLHPRRYGQTPHPGAEFLDPLREAWDLELLEGVLRHPTLPILGICLGIQELNVACGGTLIQHVPDLGGNLEHRAPETGDRLHGVSLGAGTRLAAVLGGGPLQVTTRHHQAVDRVGRGLLVAARAEDGLVEAVEGAAAGRFVIGVQWHPERNADSPASRALFAAFVAACAARPGAVRARRRVKSANVE
jgi:putative glutamine amidotransferase